MTALQRALGIIKFDLGADSMSIYSIRSQVSSMQPHNYLWPLVSVFCLRNHHSQGHTLQRRLQRRFSRISSFVVIGVGGRLVECAKILRLRRATEEEVMISNCKWHFCRITYPLLKGSPFKWLHGFPMVHRSYRIRIFFPSRTPYHLWA
jgi:hypothetical protein